MSYNAYKSVWLNPNIEYIFNSEIIEYDMRDAGFSIIKQYGLLPSDKIIELEKLGKGIDRHIAIGKLQGTDKDFSKEFSNKFAEMRMVFLSSNGITDNDIISVKKDAIFAIGQYDKLRFGKVEFAIKNRYTSYLRFSEVNDIEIYYSDDQTDVKNMGTSLNKHRLYLFEFIRRVMGMIENKDPKVKRFMMNFIKKYKSGELDEEYYIKFDRMSKDVDILFNYQKIIIPLLQIAIKEII